MNLSKIPRFSPISPGLGLSYLAKYAAPLDAAYSQKPKHRNGCRTRAELHRWQFCYTNKPASADRREGGYIILDDFYMTLSLNQLK